jgi:murein DD-endopeptidase MepM/ murein hydrolase activator NlpD
MSWIKPFPDKKITGHYGTLSEYRKRNGMQPHSGTDWAMKQGTPIPAIAKGTIVGVYFSKVLGNVIEQRVMDKDGKLWYIGYCHLAKAPTLRVGDKVQAGDPVGLVGNTGSASTGAHLHATASKRIMGVLGATADKVDLYKLIEENSAKQD